MPAVGKPFELRKMPRQRRCDIGLALDRVYRIIFATEHEGRALDASKIGKHVERVAFAARFYERSTSDRITARRAISGSRGVRV